MNLYLGYVLCSAVLDIFANLALEKSHGFRHKGWGLLAVALIMGAFALLAFAVNGMDLFAAYAIWGALTIVGTAILTWWWFGHSLHWVSMCGLGLLLLSIVLIRMG
ncbi:DMT family transporter [Isoalcanivorax beigongshangi]|uniref:Spermidine export protein MdtI n=1 Tax=Isoalcanivorax beigongshangi TaxID=3238810 RepID=A0ABV4AK92_9GAMM